MLVTESGLTLMGADTPNSMSYTPGNSYSVSLSGGDEAELRRFWEELSPEGTIAMPLERAPWGDFFGMCADKFGVSWLINIATPQSAGS
jgi:PhnB protein